MLAMGIPALTPSTGRMQIRTAVIPGNHQFDLNSENPNDYNFKPNGWPIRPDPDGQKWLHCDMKDVAYLYNYRLFDKMIQEGNLQ